MCLLHSCVHGDTSFLTSFLTSALTHRSFVLKGSLLRRTSVSLSGWTNSQPSADLGTSPSLHAAWVGLLWSPHCHCLHFAALPGMCGFQPICTDHSCALSHSPSADCTEMAQGLILRAPPPAQAQPSSQQQINPFLPCRAPVWPRFSSLRGQGIIKSFRLQKTFQIFE